jgi:oxygen-independent coproporphyrinogen-3 oxidase
MKAALAGGAVATEEQVSGAILATEFMLNALRLRAGFELPAFSARTGLPATVIGEPLREACRRGWLTQRGDHVQPTAVGFRFLNDLQLLFTDLTAVALA